MKCEAFILFSTFPGLDSITSSLSFYSTSSVNLVGVKDQVDAMQRAMLSDVIRQDLVETRSPLIPGYVIVNTQLLPQSEADARHAGLYNHC